MEVPVADDAPGLAHRPMVGEPGHGLLQAAEASVSDPAFEAGEGALEGDHLTTERWPPGPPPPLPFTGERPEHDLGPERVKPGARFDHHRTHPPPPRIEHRPA